MKKLVIAVLITGLSVVWIHAQEGEMNMKPYKGSSHFLKLKDLAGKWEGTSKMHGTDMQVSVDYKVTSAGSALMETIFPGTPYEMVSIYYDKDDKVAMTHFCSLKNRPELEFKSADNNELKFNLAQGSFIKKGEHHMNALTLRWIDEDNIVQEWVSMKGGKKEDPTLIYLKRIRE